MNKNETENKFGFIYITTNNITGEKYLGRKTFTRGWQNYLGSGVELKKALKEYGRENFSKDIIFYCNNADELINAEYQLSVLYDVVRNGNFYNMLYGGGSLNFYGHKHSDETRKRMSINHADFNGSKNPAARKVNQYTLDGEFIRTWDCAADITKELGISNSHICNCCRGKRKTTGGFKWSYATDQKSGEKCA